MKSTVDARSVLGLAALLSLTVARSSSAASLSSFWSRDVAHVERGLGRRAENTTTIPAPISIAPSQYWDGIDGPWSSFALQVGTPAQNVRVQISTAAAFAWTVTSDGCPPDYVDDCANSRGFIFNTNESLTWVPNSIYNLGLEDNLGMDTTGNTGFDTATLGWQGSGAPSVPHTIVFSVASATYWIGGFGLNPQPTNFTTFVDPQPSFMRQLRTNNSIPSLSYGYTAGNQYRSNKVFGSLTLGGYDQNRFTPTNISFPFYEDISRDLLVKVSSVTTGSNTNLLPGGPINMFIDSTVSTIWLPEDACKAFEDAFGLVWNETSQFYLVNDTHHQALQDQNPSVVFTLASNGSTVDITLPYGAFDLNISYPYIANPNTSFYFPLQRAANDTQYTLGRAFLQEAYLIADYERQNFTVAPCSWDENNLQNADIVSILSVNETNAEHHSSSGGISGGVIGGVVVAIVAAIVILGLILWLLRRRKVSEKKRIAELEAKEAGGAGKESSENEGKPFISAPIGGELGGGEIHELTAPHKPYAQELDSPHKINPNRAGYSEMDGGEYFGPGKNYAHEMQGSEQPVFEMAGSDVHEMHTPDRRESPKPGSI